MAQLRDIRRRIKSVKNTQQVTRAMKMVAAAKLRRAQENIYKARPYANKLHEIIQSILKAERLPMHPLFKPQDGDDLHLIVLTGDRGLCGSFNANILRKTHQFIDAHSGNIHLTLIGKKGIDHFKKQKYPIITSYTNLDKTDTFSLSRNLGESVSQRFIHGKDSTIAVIYNEFKSAISQQVVVERLLPLDFDTETDDEYHLDFIFYPDPKSIIDLLLPRFVNSEIYRAMLESQASEFGARMSAMDSATRNADDMISDLTLLYNRARQSAITTELIEIVSGAEALEQ